MLRCIVVDDEPLAKMLIESYISRTDDLELVGGYTSAAEAYQAITNGMADVAFLDIQMPGISGLKLAAVAEKAGMRVIFTTAYRDYAVDGFRLNALDYLLKPISYEEFLIASNRALQAIVPQAENDSISVKSNYRVTKVAFNDIVYIEGLRDYVKIHLYSERPLITQMSMKSIAELLPETDFVRIHRSYIIALSAVKSFNKSSVMIDNPADSAALSLPVGETFRNSFIKLMESLK